MIRVPTSTLPFIKKYKEAGKTNTIVDGIVSIVAVIEKQTLKYQSSIAFLFSSTVFLNFPNDDADLLNAFITLIPFTYSTIVVFIALAASWYLLDFSS